jgi:hypothetical protein
MFRRCWTILVARSGHRSEVLHEHSAAVGEQATPGDLVIGNYLTEAVVPTLLHQDPCYFHRGAGSGWSRLRYALGRPCGRATIPAPCNSTIRKSSGASLAVAISNAHYAGNRTAGDAAAKLGFQIGIDTAGNILKRVLAGSGARAPSSQKMRFTKTRSQKLTSVVIGPTAASGGQLSENTYDWLLGLMETQVP